MAYAAEDGCPGADISLASAGRDAIAYLTPRVGAKHVADLKAFGRELAQRKNEILALAAKVGEREKVAAAAGIFDQAPV